MNRIGQAISVLLIAAFLSGQVWNPEPGLWAPKALPGKALEPLYDTFRRVIVPAIPADRRYMTQQARNCLWAMFLRKIILGIIAEDIEYTRTYLSRDAVSALMVEINEYIRKNCGNRGDLDQILHALAGASESAAKKAIKERDLAVEVKQQFPNALPPCNGVLTTSGVCSPDYRLFVAAVIVIALFIPGPIDDAATAGLIVRLAAP